MRVLILRYVDKESGAPEEEEKEEEEEGVWGPQGGEKMTFIHLSHMKLFFPLSPELRLQTKQLILLKGLFFLKFCTNDYVTAMYPAQGHVLLLKKLLTNPVILKCILWELVSKTFIALRHSFDFLLITN